MVLSTRRCLLTLLRGALLVCACFVDTDRCTQAGDDRPPAPQSIDGLLVLKNGSVLDGQISRVGDRFRVANDNSEIWLKHEKIDFFCRSFVEAYETKRKKIPDVTASEHLRLAEWCLRYELHPQAAREILDARRLSPSHPRIDVLDRRLRVAMQPRRAAAKAHVATSTPPSPTVHELDAFADDLSNQVIEEFVRRVQPLLVTNCATSGCHSGEEQTGFAISRRVRRGSATRRQMLNNLYNVFTYVDREQPEQSLLLTVAMDPNGPHQKAIFDRRNEAARRQLLEWLQLISEMEKPTLETILHAESGDKQRQRAGKKPASGRSIFSDGRVTSAAYADQGSPPQGSQRAAGPPESLPKPQRKVRVGMPLRRRQPHDAFDPAVFNRQFAPKSPTRPADDGAANAPAASSGD